MKSADEADKEVKENQSFWLHTPKHHIRDLEADVPPFLTDFSSHSTARIEEVQLRGECVCVCGLVGWLPWFSLC